MTPGRVTLHRATGGPIYPIGTRICYGQLFTAAIFEHVEIVDPPKYAGDWQWIQEHLVPRLAPGATFCGRLS